MQELEQRSKDLKKLVGKYDSKVFISRITTLIKGITLPSQQSALVGLISPLRQLLYIANLNLTSPSDEVSKFDFLQGEWVIIKRHLQEINEIYDETFGETKVMKENLDDEQVTKRAISLSTYNAFFHQGPLKFEEQIIEKILRVFKNIHVELKKELNLTPADFIDIYNILDELCHTKSNRPFKKQKLEEEFLDLIKEGISSGKYSFHDGMSMVAERDMDLMESLTNPAAGHFFNLNEIIGNYNKENLKTFLSLLSSERHENDSFLYFSSQNSLLDKPVYKISNERYLIIDYKILLDAIYSLLTNTAKSIVKDSNRITKTRDKFLEAKTSEVFRNYYTQNHKAKFFENYFVDESEHDLLILSGKTALIIEAKAGNIREPSFDPARAYDKIKKDFDNTINYGYEQTFKIREYFIDRGTFKIYDQKKKLLDTIDTRQFNQAFSIVVTLDKLGHVQSDLALMLTLFDDDQYPWSICIDDLEIFLLAMKKKKFSISDFHLFLNLRKNLNGNLITNDEGRVTGYFLSKKNFLKMKNEYGTYQPKAEDDIIYDTLYATELGFINERNVGLKNNPKYLKKF